MRSAGLAIGDTEKGMLVPPTAREAASPQKKGLGTAVKYGCAAVGAGWCLRSVLIVASGTLHGRSKVDGALTFIGLTASVTACFFVIFSLAEWTWTGWHGARHQISLGDEDYLLE